jgi:DNA-directed RNA polymerase alpha subunit
MTNERDYLNQFVGEDIPPSDMPIESLDLSVRVYNNLKGAGLNTIEEVATAMEIDNLIRLNLQNFVEKSLMEVFRQLKAKGYLP